MLHPPPVKRKRTIARMWQAGKSGTAWLKIFWRWRYSCIVCHSSRIVLNGVDGHFVGASNHYFRQYEGVSYWSAQERGRNKGEKSKARDIRRPDFLNYAQTVSAPAPKAAAPEKICSILLKLQYTFCGVCRKYRFNGKEPPPTKLVLILYSLHCPRNFRYTVNDYWHLPNNFVIIYGYWKWRAGITQW